MFIQIVALLSILFQILSIDAIVSSWDLRLKSLLISLEQESFIKMLKLPPLLGVAVSEYQVSGAYGSPHSQWAAWELQDMHGSKPTIHNHDRSGYACNFWDMTEQDIILLKELGVNTFRFSVEWAEIEPEEGVIDIDVLKKYLDFVFLLRQNDIVPMITMHHFSHPAWFEKKGGFAKRKNIHYFVTFCKLLFGYLGQYVPLWCTINEIGPFVFQGYINGAFPPGEHSLKKGLQVMANMLEAHTLVYKKLKKMPYGDRAQIGLVHQYLSFESHDQSWKGLLNAAEQVPVRFMNYIFNDAMIAALKSDVIFPFIPSYRRHIKGLSKSFDFIGLNFYSRVVIESQITEMVRVYLKTRKVITPAFPTCRANQGEVMTDMEYGICPESFYAAIMDLNQLNVPIYITENGIADADDSRREMYIRLYMFALSEAIKSGANVAGYYYWSFMDNFEWDLGWVKKFGLYAVDLHTKERKLRDGARIYQAICKYHLGDNVVGVASNE